jgi:AraC-like DNA-binding protein
MLTPMNLPLVSPEELRRGSSANDAFVERVLDAMRADPLKKWTLAQLAQIAGLSRSAFSQHFTKAVGRPPLKWLAEQRLRLAEQRLAETDLPIGVIGAEIGYRTVFAFSKAFKRLFGVAPATFRRSGFRAAA